MVEAASVIEELRTIVGNPGLVLAEDMAPFLLDWMERYRGDAVAVVRPADTEEVSKVISCCAEHGLAVVPQGGNTGLSGGSIPTAVPSVVLSLQRMNSIEAVDPDRFALTVQAGATIESIQEAARAVDRSFAPDWGARGTASIGGAISTNAGGINVLHSGSMRENILGLEVVLANGRIWNGLRSLRKDSSGVDLKQLFIGAEGTLGVVTRAVLRLQSHLAHQQTAFVALSDVDRLLELLALARRTGGLTAFELIPELGIQAVCEKFPSIQRPLPAAISDWYALIRMSGSEPVSDQLATLLGEATDLGLVVDAVVASTADQETNLWTLRDELPAHRLFPHGDIGIKFDVAVPIDLLPNYLAELTARCETATPAILPYSFGHAGDGNLHLYLMPGIDADEATVEAFAANRIELRTEVYELTWGYGGTISAEHGIGQSLRSEIVGQKSEVELDLMHRVKAALDPDSVFNPGKLLPDQHH